MKHIVIFSHGFGVDKTSRGLFTDLVPALGEIEPIMIDYNEYDEAGNNVVQLFSAQSSKLSQAISQAREQNPDAIIDLICHSQGCIVAGLAHPDKIRRIVLLAPLDQIVTPERWKRTFGARPGTILSETGTSRLERSDGSFTYLPAEYFREASEVSPLALYESLGKCAKVLLVRAGADEIIGETSFSGLGRNFTIETIDADHNLSNVRPQLAARVAEFLK
jgi:pimeloyl-ACP methyl ester carboxylesterase